MRPAAAIGGAALLLATVLAVATGPALAADKTPSLSATASVSVPGAPVSISGDGFTTGETVYVTLGARSVETIALGGGHISTVLPIPAVPSGTLIVSAFGETSGASALAYLWVAGFTPSVTPDAWYVLPGAPLHFSGMGFAPSETITAAYGSTTLATYTTDGAGNFSGPADSLPVSLMNTTATITFTGNVSHTPTSVTLTIGQLYPSITPSAWYLRAGSDVLITGSGFAPSETVRLAAGSDTMATTSADVSGNFPAARMHTPWTASGPLALTATGEESGAAAHATITLAAPSPWLTLDTYWARAGSLLSIFGFQFAPGEIVRFFSDRGDIGTTTADGSGNTSLVATHVPFAPAGAITISGAGVMSGANAHATMTVAPVYVDLELEHYAGAEGDAIHFIGRGYLANEPIALTTDRTGDTPVATFETDGSGNLDASWTIPADFAPGTLMLTMTSAHSFDIRSITYYVTGG